MTTDAPHLQPVAGAIPLTRARRDELDEEIRAAARSPVVQALLEAMDGGLLVLNAHRQIVAASLRGLAPGAEANLERALGLRPGEALGCVYAFERPEGCGAAEACRTCGAVRAVLACQTSRRAADDELLITTRSGACELGVRASVLELGGRRFTVVALLDRSDARRRGVLEQAFLHDLANLLTPLSATAELLVRAPENRLRGAGEKVARLVKRLEGEVHAQRALLDAERGSLALTPARLRPDELLRELEAAFEAHPLTRQRTLQVDRGPGPQQLETDRTLVLRVLTNMATNALEATPEGGTVRAWAAAPRSASRWACGFHVHNAAAIPPAVAARIFQRSFSTKASKGRGIGTYGMKLLGERYLGGEVGFTSSEAEGTTFSLWLPESPPTGE